MSGNFLARYPVDVEELIQVCASLGDRIRASGKSYLDRSAATLLVATQAVVALALRCMAQSTGCLRKRNNTMQYRRKSEFALAIQANPSLSQHQLAGQLGISLGKATYCLAPRSKRAWSSWATSEKIRTNANTPTCSPRRTGRKTSHHPGLPQAQVKPNSKLSGARSKS